MSSTTANGGDQELERAVLQEQKSLVLAPKAKKPRIDCIDGCRFALVFPIIVGHFVKFGTQNKVLLKLLTQENVFVGGFFIISGYVAGYVATNVGERDYDRKKLANPELFFWQKVMSYYPLHFLVSTLFSPMFIMVDRWMNHPWKTTVFHGFLNYSLSQAWFPSDAEIWNPPTWFLSALSFVNFTLPTMILPQVAALSKDGLRKLILGLGALSIVQKVSYSQAWQFYCRGEYICRTSSPHLWNTTRFHPFWALVEVTMGIAAARDVMLDTPEERGSRWKVHPVLLYVAAHASVALRITKFNLNDALIRSTLFVPLYLKFLQAMHRDCLSSSPTLMTRCFGSSLMTRLGALAFPMFIMHGPIGQLLYKKAVANRVFGRVMPMQFFPVYLGIVILASHVVNEGFVKNKKVQRLSAWLSQFLADRTTGMLRDLGDQVPSMNQKALSFEGVVASKVGK